jgi:hypothetical protein
LVHIDVPLDWVGNSVQHPVLMMQFGNCAVATRSTMCVASESLPPTWL